MTTALNHSKMKKYLHISVLFFCLLLATTMSAQFMTPPDQADKFGLEQFLNNGAMDLKNLNPANFITNKQRRFLEQEWTVNTWQSLNQERKEFAANCGLPVLNVKEDYDALSRTFKTTDLDSFIYANNRLKTWSVYFVVNGVRTLSSVAQLTYSTRAAPDTVLVSNPQLNGTTRFAYTFNASGQLTAIREDGIFNGNLFPASRAQLTYDTRGNLTRYLIEEPDGANWKTSEDNRYAYNATNQLTEKVNTFVFGSSADSLKNLFNYDTQNRLIKQFQIYGRDTSAIVVSNHNAKKRPRLLEFEQLNSPSGPLFGKATLTYQANDSLVANMVTQEKRRVADPFVNQSRFIFEYCGDAVGTNEVKKEPLSCLVFPNPASESLTIRLKENTASNADVSVVNTMGQVVFQARNHAVDTPLSISTLPNGLYVLRVQIGDKIGITNFTVLK